MIIDGRYVQYTCKSDNAHSMKKTFETEGQDSYVRYISRSWDEKFLKDVAKSPISYPLFQRNTAGQIEFIRLLPDGNDETDGRLLVWEAIKLRWIVKTK